MIKSKELTKIKYLKHGFFNSIGGTSKNIYKSLNMNSYKISRKGVNLPCALNLDEDNLDFYSEKLKEISIQDPGKLYV